MSFYYGLLFVISSTGSSPKRCRTLSLCAFIFNTDATSCDMYCLLAAYVYPLFPPFEPSEAMHLLSRCLQPQTFDTHVDSEDNLEPAVRARLPMQCTPVTTNGDGACAIHSVWGVPDNLSQLTCPDARRLATEALGESLPYLRTNIAVEFREDVTDLAQSLWNEFMVGYFEGLWHLERSLYTASRAPRIGLAKENKRKSYEAYVKILRHL